jgi:hypothetical protein
MRMSSNELPKNQESPDRVGDGGIGDANAIATNTVACDACGAAMKPMGHCKYWCLRCGFLRTCNDVI